MRIGLLGGSFDPVHLGHLLLAECCREQCGLDQVWFVPAAIPPHKKEAILTPAVHRVAMLKLATAGHERFGILTYEVDRGGVCYTVDTLRRLRDERPEGELFLLLGADMLLDLPHWREATEVCRLALPVGVRRPGVGRLDLTVLGELVAPERIDLIRQHQVEMPEIGLSSTEIRRRVAGGRSVRFQVPRAVEEYIREHGLYRGVGSGTED